MDGDGFGNACGPDLNDDSGVDFSNLAALESLSIGGDPDADLNGDGIVDAEDLDILASFLFSVPVPSALVQVACPTFSPGRGDG